jgi:hypothetical protein
MHEDTTLRGYVIARNNANALLRVMEGEAYWPTLEAAKAELERNPKEGSAPYFVKMVAYKAE